MLVLILTATTLGVCIASQYWINETVQVPAGGSTYWSGTLYKGDNLQGFFNVGGGDIKFYILDASNYAEYSNGQSFISYYKNQAIHVPQIDFTVPYDGTWFVLLDNSYSIWTNKAVTVSLTLNSNSYSSTAGYSGTVIGVLAVIGGIAIFVVIVGLLVYVNSKSQRRITQPTYYPTQ